MFRVKEVRRFKSSPFEVTCFLICAKFSSMLSIWVLEEAAYVIKGLWQRRNEVIHSNKFIHPNQLLSKARNDYIEYKQAITSTRSMISTSSTQSCSQWKKPPPGMLKLNWDAACNVRLKELD